MATINRGKPDRKWNSRQNAPEKRLRKKREKEKTAGICAARCTVRTQWFGWNVHNSILNSGTPCRRRRCRQFRKQIPKCSSSLNTIFFVVCVHRPVVIVWLRSNVTSRSLRRTPFGYLPLCWKVFLCLMHTICCTGTRLRHTTIVDRMQGKLGVPYLPPSICLIANTNTGEKVNCLQSDCPFCQSRRCSLHRAHSHTSTSPIPIELKLYDLVRPRNVRNGNSNAEKVAKNFASKRFSTYVFCSISVAIFAVPFRMANT